MKYTHEGINYNTVWTVLVRRNEDYTVAEMESMTKNFVKNNKVQLYIIAADQEYINVIFFMKKPTRLFDLKKYFPCAGFEEVEDIDGFAEQLRYIYGTEPFSRDVDSKVDYMHMEVF